MTRLTAHPDLPTPPPFAGLGSLPDALRVFPGEPKPSPVDAPDRGPTVWVVKQASGGTLRVLAEDHYTYARPEGTELRFFNGDGGDGRHPVATIRAGSWHWCVAESALEPKADKS